MSLKNRKDNDDLDRQRRAKAFKRRSRAAAAGIHLPTYHELLLGSPFLGGNLRDDAQSFAERLLPKIPADTAFGKIAHEKIRALTLFPLSVDFREASHALQDYAVENTKLEDDLLECARRCELYAAAAGSNDSAFTTARWAMRRAHDILATSDRAYGFGLAAIGWMILANDYLHGSAINNDAPRLAHTLARHLFERMTVERDLRRSEDEPKPKEEKPVAQIAAELDAAFEVANPGDHLSIVVLKALGNPDVGGGKTVAQEFAGILGKRLPLVTLPDLADVRRTLTMEFPHALHVVDAMLDSLANQPHVRLRPCIFVGSPGCGKTAFASRFFHLLGVPSERFPCGGVSDSSLTGCARRWSTGEPSLPLSLVRRHMCASPGIVLDEIEKVGTSNHNGNLLDALLGLLERESSESWLDPYVQSSVNLSNILWLATANSLDGLPLPLKDRCRILLFPDPEPHHLQVLANRLLRRIVVDRGLDERWALPLDGMELEALGRAWPGGSLRMLERLVEGAFKARSLATVLH